MTYNKEILKCFQCNDLIRLGRMKDGGYVIPKRLTKKSIAMISCGISTDWSFENDFISFCWKCCRIDFFKRRMPCEYRRKSKKNCL